jgi:hypothetical protein
MQACTLIAAKMDSNCRIQFWLEVKGSALEI